MKRSSYLQYSAYVPLDVKPLKVWGYGRNKKFVCRVEINRAGLAVYAGQKGTKKLVNMSWEGLVKRLQGTH